MSGIRVHPGLKRRAVYVVVARSVWPGIRVLTNVSGSQDDGALSQRIASAPVRERVASVAGGIARGEIQVPVAYEGPEFANPA